MGLLLQSHYMTLLMVLIGFFTKWVSCFLRSAHVSMFRRNMLVRDVPTYAPGDATQSMSGGCRTARPTTAFPTVSKKIFWPQVVSCSWNAYSEEVSWLICEPRIEPSWQSSKEISRLSMVNVYCWF